MLFCYRFRPPPDGVICFFVEDRKMRFEINAAASEREALQLSAKLMSVATVVRE
jgi:hypothetical protein